jgi:hypothetical protein
MARIITKKDSQLVKQLLEEFYSPGYIPEALFDICDNYVQRIIDEEERVRSLNPLERFAYLTYRKVFPAIKMRDTLKYMCAVSAIQDKTAKGWKDYDKGQNITDN